MDKKPQLERKGSLNPEITQRLVPNLPKAKETCTLTMPGKEPVELPVFESSDNIKFIDIR